MDYEATIAELRRLVGQRVAVSIVARGLGPAEGYIGDFSGRIERIDEPIPAVDAPVHYVRVADGGFGVHAGMFEQADWETTAGQRDLKIQLRDVELSITAL